MIFLQKLKWFSIKYDFFQHYTSSTTTEIINDESILEYINKKTEFEEIMKKLDKEISYLKEIIKDKNRIISLLEEKLEAKDWYFEIVWLKSKNGRAILGTAITQSPKTSYLTPNPQRH